VAITSRTYTDSNARKLGAMPHLQDESEDKHRRDDEIDADARSSCLRTSNTMSGADLPIQEARKGYLGSSDPVVTALACKVSAASTKVESFESTESTACSPPSNRESKPVITPSSSTSNAKLAFPSRSSPSDGPILTVYGKTNIVPSPIRVKRRVSQSEEEEEEEHIPLNQPTHLRFGCHPVDGHPGTSCFSSDLGSHYTNNINEKVSRAKKVKLTGDGVSDSVVASKVLSATGVLKKRIISPTSSGEKGEDDDHTESSGKKYRHLTPYERIIHVQGPAAYQPHPASFVFAGPPPLGAGYPLYHGYLPHGLPCAPPYLAGHLRGHPGACGFPPPYLHATAHMMHQYRHQQSPFPSHHRVPGPISPKEGMASYAEAKGEGRGSKQPFKSVAEWQQVTLSSGKPPSANRCVPLKEPIPSKHWGYVV
jgi:hypothetical protein